MIIISKSFVQLSATAMTLVTLQCKTPTCPHNTQTGISGYVTHFNTYQDLLINCCALLISIQID